MPDPLSARLAHPTHLLSYLNPPKLLCEMRIITLILGIEKMRYRELTCPKARKWQSWDLKPGLTPKVGCFEGNEGLLSSNAHHQTESGFQSWLHHLLAVWLASPLTSKLNLMLSISRGLVRSAENRGSESPCRALHCFNSH